MGRMGGGQGVTGRQDGTDQEHQGRGFRPLVRQVRGSVHRRTKQPTGAMPHQCGDERPEEEGLAGLGHHGSREAQAQDQGRHRLRAECLNPTLSPRGGGGL